jgi:RHS repeat-associated protein
LKHKGCNSVSNGGNSSAQKIKYQGQELEEELGKNTYAFQWRDYDPAIGRFNKIDRFAEKYNRISPYAFTANNPIFFNEIKGDSINVKSIQRYDTANGTNHTQNIITDLNEQTGYTFEVNGTGQLVYKTDDDGNAVVSTTTDADGNTTQNGSAEARKMMKHAVSTTNQAYARITTTSNSGVRPTGGSLINLNPNQINSFVSGVNNVNSKTMGWGMTFMHESQHSNVAEGGAVSHGREKTTFGRTGTVVDRMNTVRSELNAQGGNYGIRTSYRGLYFNPTTRKPIYIPFNSSSKSRMSGGNTPSSSSMFIQIR